VLQSFDRGNMIVDRFTANVRVELDQESPIGDIVAVTAADSPRRDTRTMRFTHV